MSRFARRTLGCVQIEVRAHLGGRRLNQDNGRGGERCQASQFECNNKGDLFGSSTSMWIIVKFECTTTSGKPTITRLRRRPVQQQTKQQHQCIRRQRQARLHRALSLETTNSCNAQPVEQAGMDLGVQPHEDHEGRESKRLRLVGDFEVSADTMDCVYVDVDICVEMSATTTNEIIMMASEEYTEHPPMENKPDA